MSKNTNRLLRALPICVAFLLLSCDRGSPDSSDEIPLPADLFAVELHKPDDRIDIGRSDQRVVVEIGSPSGIGELQLTRKQSDWPATLFLRLGLGGLESLTIAAGDVTLKIAVLSHGNHERHIHLLANGKEGPPLEVSSPYWTDVRAFSSDGQPSAGLPGQGGWFELAIPPALLEPAGDTLEIKWIDFYR